MSPYKTCVISCRRCEIFSIVQIIIFGNNLEIQFAINSMSFIFLIVQGIYIYINFEIYSCITIQSSDKWSLNTSLIKRIFLWFRLLEWSLSIDRFPFLNVCVRNFRLAYKLRKEPYNSWNIPEVLCVNILHSLPLPSHQQRWYCLC